MTPATDRSTLGRATKAGALLLLCAAAALALGLNWYFEAQRIGGEFGGLGEVVGTVALLLSLPLLAAALAAFSRRAWLHVASALIALLYGVGLLLYFPPWDLARSGALLLLASIGLYSAALLLAASFLIRGLWRHRS